MPHPPWHEHARRKADPDRLPERARDAELSVHIRRIFAENFSVYGVHKVWRLDARRRCGCSVHRPAVEYPTLEWVDWFNNRQLLEPIGNIPPAEAEANYYATLQELRMAA